MREIEIRYEPSKHNGGSRVYENGKAGMWHSGYPDRTLVWLYSQSIQRNSKDGGTITIVHTHKDNEVYHVESCPTDHANVQDDFMGGTICMDCKANW